jgi:hypothetical protein
MSGIAGTTRIPGIRPKGLTQGLPKVVAMMAVVVVGRMVVRMVMVVVMIPEKVEVIGLTGEAARKKPDADPHYQKSRGQLQ